MGYMIDFFNNNGGGTYLINEGLPLLECAPAITNNGGGLDGFDYDCFENTGFQLGEIGENGQINDVYDLITVLDECTDIINSPGGTIEWVDVEFNIFLLSGTGNDGPIVSRPYGSLVDNNGELMKTDFTLESGLYNIAVQTKEGYYISIIKEVKKTLTNGITLAEHLNVTVFPVPITGDDFMLNLQADYKMKFQYILSDLDGTELYKKNFVVQEGHNKNHSIKANGNASFPSGILVNTFIFEDGSSKSFQTMKN
jgi:hypothetical protein